MDAKARRNPRRGIPWPMAAFAQLSLLPPAPPAAPSAQLLAARRRYIDRRYGKGAFDWKQRALAAQGGRCARCGTADAGGLGWHLDHDHRTGKPRHVLCFYCNIALGWVEHVHPWPARAFAAAAAIGDGGMVAIGAPTAPVAFALEPPSHDNARRQQRRRWQRRTTDRRHGKGAFDWKQRALAAQGGRCAMCGTTTPVGTIDGAWTLRRDREGRWRNVVCAPCNLSLRYVERGTWNALAFVASLDSLPP